MEHRFDPADALCACEREFAADDSALGDVIAFSEDALGDAGCPMKTAMQISVALEECFVNVAHYGYPDGKGSVRLRVLIKDGCAVLRLRDTGIPFDPLAVPDPDVTLPAEKRRIGGLGIYMTKKIMDSVEYAYENGQNILTLTRAF